MELQWSLILFTLFVPWSVGLFATQSVYALRGAGSRSQMPALIASVVLLAVGGIAVFFHLQHWERIFNGFGHITSGITQELIAIVVLVVFMVVTFAVLRRDGEGKMPRWLAIVNIVVAALVVIVVGHSYMMPSRPAWDSVLNPLSLLGAACVLGPATFCVIEGLRGDASQSDSMTNLVGSGINVATTIAYVAAIAASAGSFASVGFYFDPTHPTWGMVDSGALSPFAGDALVPTVIAILAAFVALALAFSGKRAGNWKVCGSLIALCGVVACVALRVVFYLMGASVYMFY